MGSRWNEVPLEELFDFRSGLSKPRSSFGSGYGFLAFKDVFDNYFVPENLTELVNSSERERDSCSIRKGDVFLTRTSETMEDLGMSSVALEDHPNATFNGFTKRLRPKNRVRIVPEFAGYYFRSPYFRRAVTAMSSPSTRASLNNEMLGRLRMILPDPENQKAIGFFLKSLDDKIELNRKTIQTLEKINQEIFSSWFVDFDPVVAKAAGIQPCAMNEFTSSLFPESFEGSKIGQIPAGWHLEPLDEIANYQNGLALQKFRPIDGEEPLPVVKIAQLRAGMPTGDEWASPMIKPACILEDGDVVFSWSGSLLLTIWCGGRAALNQHLFKVTSDRFPKWFYYLWTKSHLPEFQAIASERATTMGHIRRHHLTEALCVVPTLDLIGQADREFSDRFDLIIANNLENRSLTAMRDLLLPKLISGEIQLCDAERTVEEAF